MTQAEFNAWIRARFNLWTKSDVDAEIRKAVETEREACAKLCEELHYTGFGYEPIAPRQAAAIRARGEN